MSSTSSATANMNAQPLEAVDPDKVHRPTDKWDTSFAGAVARHDFDMAAQYRSNNHDWRWRAHDELYLGWIQQKYWEGTRIPRASLSCFVAFEQIEARIPRVMQALFQDDPMFDVIGINGTDQASAKKVRDILDAQLNQSNFREVMRRAVKSGYQYGNGIIELYWLNQERERMKYVPQFRPKTRAQADPFTGMRMHYPTGEFDRRVIEKKVKEVENRPCVRNVPIKDFYIDPNTPGPSPKEARYCCTRSYMTVDEVDALRDSDGFDIPDRFWLNIQARNKRIAEGDLSKSMAEQARQGSWQPQMDQSGDPAAGRLEIIRYWTTDRLVWLLNRDTVIFNKPNPYGFIPFYNSFYTDVIDRFYGLAITDIVEGEQRLQQGILNGRIDELALAIHPPTVKKRGNATQSYQLRVRPGAMADAEDPSKDVVRLYPQDITKQSFLEIQASDQRVEKSIGASEPFALGSTAPANPSARTATGAQLQGAAVSTRIQYNIESIENLVIEPLLQDMLELDRQYLDPSKMIDSVRGDQIDPLSVYGSDVRFKMRAGTRMQSKMALLQLFPTVLQTAMNPALMEQLVAQGQTVDMAEMFRILEDISGYKTKAELIRPLTPQEKQAIQARQQQQLAPDMVKMQMQRERMQSIGTQQINKGELDMLKSIVDRLIDHHANVNLSAQEAVQDAINQRAGADNQEGAGASGTEE